MKTTKKELENLRDAKVAADKAYFKYRQAYNKEHNVKSGNIIAEIIAFHKAGLSNQDIVDKGYNKHTVGRQVNLYKKGKKVEKTTVRKFFNTK